MEDKIKEIMEEWRWTTGNFNDPEMFKWIQGKLNEVLTSYKKKLLEELPEETDCEFWMKKLTAPESDWTHGHSHGFNACLEQVKSIINNT